APPRVGWPRRGHQCAGLWTVVAAAWPNRNGHTSNRSGDAADWCKTLGLDLGLWGRGDCSSSPLAVSPHVCPPASRHLCRQGGRGGNYPPERLELDHSSTRASHEWGPYR